MIFELRNVSAMTGCKLSLGVLKRFASPFFLADAFLRTHPPLFSGFNTFSAIAAQQARISWAQKETAQTPHMRVFQFPEMRKGCGSNPGLPAVPGCQLQSRGGSAPRHRWSSQMQPPNMAAWRRWLVHMKKSKNKG